MFANVLAAALRNLARNRLYAAISIGGLAIGMAAVLLIVLFIRDELSFDRFIPRRGQDFVLMSELTAPGQGRVLDSWSVAQEARWLKLDFPEVVDAERIGWTPNTSVRRGDFEAPETVAWADPGFFRLMAYPVLAGNLDAALRRPDGLVLTRSMARKYFAQDRPLGATLELNRQAFTVAAVIDDASGSSNIAAQIFASALSPRSPISEEEAQPYVPEQFRGVARIYVRLRDPKAVEAVNRRMPAFVRTHIIPPSVADQQPAGSSFRLFLIPLDQLHLTADWSAAVPPGNRQALMGLGAIAALVLVLASVNFVNLMTARAGRRAVEVGVRKAAGASGGHLIVQFLGEALLYSAVAMICAVALVELLLPWLNAVTMRRIAFAYWRAPFLPELMGLTLAVGFLAGAYPAFVLSSFRPSAVLKGGQSHAGGSPAIRRLLVTVQFAIVIALLLGLLVIQRQTRFALDQALGLDKDRVLSISVSPPCRGAFAAAVASVPGVLHAACASAYAIGHGGYANLTADLPGGQSILLYLAPVDFGFFDTFGVRLAAGRRLSPDRGEDGLAFAPRMDGFRFPANAIANSAMARAFAPADPGRAVGATVRIRINEQAIAPVRIVGVAPDFAFDLTRGPVKPTLYYVDPNWFRSLNVKLAAGDARPALSAIDRLWKRMGEPRPIRRQFINDYLNNVVYVGVIRQGVILTALSIPAIVIAGLGLFAQASFTAERRTKEIGVRKALGASRADILLVLLWSFTQPVLWANLIAGPIGWWAMTWWLNAFAARIALSPWMFLMAGGGALLIAAATVSAHALRVASAKPVGALRYE